ncbi:hypothetical protein M885DRAFT_579691 [Pelagophyceae sp. CCMP2097]|nr:hypothetical protein M885DRAFT_579691 [Pelagophyceae sp. CCMP2097]
MSESRKPEAMPALRGCVGGRCGCAATEPSWQCILTRRRLVRSVVGSVSLGAADDGRWLLDNGETAAKRGNGLGWVWCCAARRLEAAVLHAWCTAAHKLKRRRAAARAQTRRGQKVHAKAPAARAAEPGRPVRIAALNSAARLRALEAGRGRLASALQHGHVWPGEAGEGLLAAVVDDDARRRRFLEDSQGLIARQRRRRAVRRTARALFWVVLYVRFLTSHAEARRRRKPGAADAAPKDGDRRGWAAVDARDLEGALEAMRLSGERGALLRYRGIRTKTDEEVLMHQKYETLFLDHVDRARAARRRSAAAKVKRGYKERYDGMMRQHATDEARLKATRAARFARLAAPFDRAYGLLAAAAVYVGRAGPANAKLRLWQWRRSVAVATGAPTSPRSDSDSEVDTDAEPERDDVLGDLGRRYYAFAGEARMPSDDAAPEPTRADPVPAPRETSPSAPRETSPLTRKRHARDLLDLAAREAAAGLVDKTMAAPEQAAAHQSWLWRTTAAERVTASG